MLYVNGDNSIQLTREDTARISVSIVNDLTGNEYEMHESSKLTLSIKKRETDSQPLVKKFHSGNTYMMLNW